MVTLLNYSHGYHGLGERHVGASSRGRCVRERDERERERERQTQHTPQAGHIQTRQKHNHEFSRQQHTDRQSNRQRQPNSIFALFKALRRAPSTNSVGGSEDNQEPQESPTDKGKKAKKPKSAVQDPLVLMSCE